MICIVLGLVTRLANEQVPRLREDLVPVSALQARTSRVVREVESSGRAKVITREGVAVAVLVGVDEYERLAEDASLGRLLREIRQAERELDAGDGIPQEEIERELEARWRR